MEQQSLELQALKQQLCNCYGCSTKHLAFQSTTQCGKYYTVVTGNDCSLIVVNNTITLSLFEAINPSINANCTNLVPGLAYCVSPTADWNSTSTTTTTSGYVSPPDPTPTGTTSYCYVWHAIVANDNCALLESGTGSLSQNCSNGTLISTLPAAI
tara:strand:- start:105 stop:569 length:465 start_codon:yes stop_codon:yes gene_type:complete